MNTEKRKIVNIRPASSEEELKINRALNAGIASSEETNKTRKR